jgi:hypothetical protein
MQQLATVNCSGDATAFDKKHGFEVSKMLLFLGRQGLIAPHREASYGRPGACIA